MKTKTSTLLLALFLTCTNLISQSALTGKITDSQNAPLPFANVLLLTAEDSALVKGVVATEEGKFTLEDLHPGHYLLSFMMISYQTRYTDPIQISDSQQPLKLGTIALRESATDLETVEVTARKPLFEQEVDRLVVNVQSSITAAGNSALEVLERSPGIVVDRQNGSISMGGKNGVIVLINGKRNRMELSAVVQLLAGMNASNVEKIELITAPPAKYDAEGDAGMINIVLKKNEQNGFNGNFSVYAGYGAQPKAGGSATFNLRRNRFNLFGDYSYSYNDTEQLFSNFRRVDYQERSLVTEASSNREALEVIHNGRLGIDVELGDKTVLGALVSGYDRSWDMDALNTITIAENGTPASGIRMPNRELNHWQNLMGNINLLHTFAPGHSLSVDIDYLYYYNDNPSDYTISEAAPPDSSPKTSQMRLGKVTPIHIWVGKADYSHQLGKKIKMETGVKGTLSRFDNGVLLESLEQGAWIPEPKFSQDYYLNEKIGAAYTSFKFNFDNKNALTLGLRYEYTDTQLDTDEETGLVDRTYGNLFPTVFYGHDFDENNSLQFSYNRRITRPSYSDLAPFVIFIDPFTFMSGNASLQASVTDALRLGYRFKNHHVSVQYSYDQDPIAQFQPTVDPETNEQVLQAQNLDFRHTVSATLTLPFYLTDWWEMQNSIMGIWQQIHASYSDGPVTLEQQNIRLNTTQTFKLPADFAFEISAFYQSSVLFGIMEFAPLGAVNLGIQKTFAKNHGTLSLNWSDIFDTNKWMFSANQPDLFLDFKLDAIFETRILRLTYTRSFGSSQVKASRKRQTGSAAEQQRVTN